MIETSQVFDTVVIGGGPAGLTAAIWCRDLGLSVIVLEQAPAAGGQLLRVFNPIANYPGIETISGSELADRFAGKAHDFGAVVHVRSRAERIYTANMTVNLEDGTHIRGRSLIAATGVRRRQLNVPGETEFQDKGILETGQKDRHLLRGKRVAVVGGGDAAFENAKMFSELADRVFVIHRRDEFAARPEFVDAVRGRGNVELLTGMTVGEFVGTSQLTGLHIVDRSTGETRSIEVDAALVRIGVVPNSELFADVLELDRKGYIIANSRGETGVEGVFAVGDVANPDSPTIITAAGSGAAAAKAIFSLINKVM